jgi:Zn-dependent protease
MADPAKSLSCPVCGSQIAGSLLSCPGCGRLVYSEELNRIAAEASQAPDSAQALALWRRALELLPPGSVQHQNIQWKINELSREALKAPVFKKKGAKGAAAGAASVALLLWKFKFAAVFLATKAKLLLFGLTKASTFLSMFVSFGVYWAAWGWKFALGVVLSIYVHEMGHVEALRRFGIRATAPMFIPGFGALVRMKQYPTNAHEDARVGLAGPLFGLAAAFACYTVALLGGGPIWMAIARFGAWITLLNLIPVWQLDGGRGFRALTRQHRWIMAAAMGAAWYVTHEVLLLFLLLGAVYRAWQSDAPVEPDRVVLMQFLFLIAALSALSMIPVAVQPL